MAKSKSERREQPETATTHVANTMITNDTLPYDVMSLNYGKEIIQ